MISTKCAFHGFKHFQKDYIFAYASCVIPVYSNSNNHVFSWICSEQFLAGVAGKISFVRIPLFIFCVVHLVIGRSVHVSRGRCMLNYFYNFKCVVIFCVNLNLSINYFISDVIKYSKIPVYSFFVLWYIFDLRHVFNLWILVIACIAKLYLS